MIGRFVTDNAVHANEAEAGILALRLIRQSQFFTCEPLPDGIFRIEVRDDDMATQTLTQATKD